MKLNKHNPKQKKKINFFTWVVFAVLSIVFVILINIIFMYESN